MNELLDFVKIHNHRLKLIPISYFNIEYSKNTGYIQIFDKFITVNRIQKLFVTFWIFDLKWNIFLQVNYEKCLCNFLYWNMNEYIWKWTIYNIIGIENFHNKKTRMLFWKGLTFYPFATVDFKSNQMSHEEAEGVPSPTFRNPFRFIICVSG